MSELSPAEVLRKTADLLDARGWCQAHLVNFKGECCAFGGMIEVCRVSNTSGASKGLEVFAKYLDPSLTDFETFSSAVFRWNDDVCGSKEQCVKTLRDAADAYEAKEKS